MKTYIIAGMGRSATSFLAQSLKKNGVDIGKKFYMGQNPNGGFEDQDFVDLNKKVFLEAGMEVGIHSLPADRERMKQAFDKYKEEYKELIKKKRNAVDGLWGVKEPRLTLILEFLIEIILEEDEDPFFYLAFRNPKKVAESLNRLNPEIDKEEAEQTAREYNKIIIKFLQKNYV